MKLLCLLLSFYIILLSGRPCCADNDCVGKTKVRAAQSSSNQEDCQGCSPFYTCGTCAGFIMAQPLTFSFKPVAETRATIYLYYRQPYVDEVCLSIWQPPQIS